MASAVEPPADVSETDGSETPSHASRHDTTSPTPAPPAPIRLERIGRFRILKELGAGAFGRVYLAHHEVLDRSVALKVMRPGVGMLASAATVELMLNEARTAASIRHPGIVEVYDADWDDALELGYIAMEYVTGGTLQARLVGRLDRDQVVELIATTAEAVHHAHRAQCVHRDLKPGNILLDADGRPKVADFGLALRSDDEELHRGEFAGSLPYMSPEQVRGEAHRLDGRSDVWSLGVIAYELLCGRRPFTGAPDSIVDQILHRPARPPRQFTDSVDRELEVVILRCLKKNVELRFDTAQDLADALRALQPQENRGTTAFGKASRFRQASRRFALLAVLGAAAFGGWHLSQWRVASRIRPTPVSPPAISPAELEDQLYRHYKEKHLPIVNEQFGDARGIRDLIRQAKALSGKTTLESLTARDFAEAAYPDFHRNQFAFRSDFAEHRLPIGTSLSVWINSLEAMPTALPDHLDGDRPVDWWLMYFGIHKAMNSSIVSRVRNEFSFLILNQLVENLTVPGSDKLLLEIVNKTINNDMERLYDENARLMASMIANEFRQVLESGEFDQEACRQRFCERLQQRMPTLMTGD